MNQNGVICKVQDVCSDHFPGEFDEEWSRNKGLVELVEDDWEEELERERREREKEENEGNENGDSDGEGRRRMETVMETLTSLTSVDIVKGLKGKRKIKGNLGDAANEAFQFPWWEPWVYEGEEKDEEESEQDMDSTQRRHLDQKKIDTKDLPEDMNKILQEFLKSTKKLDDSNRNVQAEIGKAIGGDPDNGNAKDTGNDATKTEKSTSTKSTSEKNQVSQASQGGSSDEKSVVTNLALRERSETMLLPLFSDHRMNSKERKMW